MSSPFHPTTPPPTPHTLTLFSLPLFQKEEIVFHPAKKEIDVDEVLAQNM